MENKRGAHSPGFAGVLSAKTVDVTDEEVFPCPSWTTTLEVWLSSESDIEIDTLADGRGVDR